MGEALTYIARRCCELNLERFQPSVSAISDDPEDNRVLWTETMVSAVGGVWHVVRFYGPDGAKEAWGARFHAPAAGSTLVSEATDG